MPLSEAWREKCSADFITQTNHMSNITTTRHPERSAKGAMSTCHPERSAEGAKSKDHPERPERRREAPQSKAREGLSSPLLENRLTPQSRIGILRGFSKRDRGRLAQWESTSLTRKGSLVLSQYRPPFQRLRKQSVYGAFHFTGDCARGLKRNATVPVCRGAL